jgi:uncharacterized lipoprotein YbaY
VTRATILLFALALAACHDLPPPTPSPVVIAPTPKVYTCDQQRQASRELAALPVAAMLRVLVNDYGVERRQLRAARGEAEPAGCSPG